ncbi:gfo/Idh/MocA family oxidoreductase [Candidatus Poribacteria bacterium]|nr:gfo/Idh/MocA family oxidoreductase [Candidatus Poribacteria bacterium]
MSNVVRVGVVGAGSISVRGIMPHLSLEDVHDRVRMTAVCDPVPGRAKVAAEKFDIPSAYESYEELLDSGNVDAITVASPIGVHYEQGKMAIQRGIHAHFNKTMTTTVEEADELIELAQKHNVKLVACPGQMLRPLFQEIRRLVMNGALGTLTWAATGAAFGRYHENESVRHGDDLLSNINPAWYFRKPGGGPLFDMTVYGLHTMTGILGPAKRVTAFSGVRIHEREFRGEMLPTDMDDNTFMVLDFGDSLFAFVYGAAAGGMPGMGTPLIFGTKGVINGGNLNGKTIDYPGKNLADEEGTLSVLPHVVGPHRKIQEAHVYEDIMQLVDWIREDKPSIVTAEHARHVIEIFDKAYRSAETGKSQELRTTFETIQV